MIGFLLRKSFYDLWDNLFRIVALNLGFYACISIPVFLPRLISQFTDSLAPVIVISIAGIFICSVYLAAVSFALKPVSDYGAFSFSDFLKSFKTAWPAGLVIGLFITLLFAVAAFIIPFYMSIEPPMLGIALAAVIFWTAVFGLLSLQFYFAVITRLDSNLKKAFKKSLLIAIDNTGFSFFLLIHNAVALALSAFLAFMFPGPAGIILYLDEAIRLRLLKYDWMEANPGADRKNIPWDALLIEEREKTGTRTFKNFIFPWKD